MISQVPPGSPSPRIKREDKEQRPPSLSSPANNATSFKSSSRFIKSEPSQQSLGRTSSLVAVKPEVIESSVPRKRVSDAAFKTEADEKDEDELSFLNPSTPTKKAKLEAPKTPLVSMGGNQNVQDAGYTVDLIVAATQAHLDAALADIAKSQSKLDDILYKGGRKSKGDISRITYLNRHIQTLRERHAGLLIVMADRKRELANESAQAALSAASVALVKPEVKALPLRPDFHNPVFNADKARTVLPPVASGSNVQPLAAPPMPPVYPGYPGMGVGMNVDPSDDEDNRDDLGHFHGRGRDMFQGPVAASEE